jgi:hypothetical protein
MTVKDIIDHCPDNRVVLRDYESGKHMNDVPVSKYLEHKVVKFYGRSHKTSADQRRETEIVVFVRTN